MRGLQIGFIGLVCLLAACGGSTDTAPPAEETPEVPVPETPEVPEVPETPSDPNAVAYSGEWIVSYTSVDGTVELSYALNITIPSSDFVEEGGFGLAIQCQNQETCDYANGSQTGATGFIGNLVLDSGARPLTVGIYEQDGSSFYFTTDTDNAVGTDSQGRDFLEGSGTRSFPDETLVNGFVTAVRVGEPRPLVQGPTTPGEPEPDPDPQPDPDPDPVPDPDPIPAPSITSFTASPATIEEGDDTRLSWSVSDADTLSISPGVGSVSGSSVTVSPDETTTYTLTASNDSGQDTASVTVRVQDPEPPPPSTPQVRYWVNSDCGRVSTTYATADGGTGQRDFGNGFVYQSDSFSRGDFLYISAQNQCGSGDVTVRIYKRDSIYRETESSGAYVIATASGTY